jgi:hypothetical protein
MSTPEKIFNVSQSQFSVARYYGGCTFNGASYHYDAESDTLTRMDVWLESVSSDKRAGKSAAKAEREKLKKLQESFVGF